MKPGPKPKKRNATIVRLRAEGWAVLRLAHRYGVSKQRIQQILERARREHEEEANSAS